MCVCRYPGVKIVRLSIFITDMLNTARCSNSPVGGASAHAASAGDL